MLPDWAAVDAAAPAEKPRAPAKSFAKHFSVVTSIPGAARTPPNRHNLTIYETARGAMGLETTAAGLTGRVPVKMPVPFAPGAFVIATLLSPAECERFIAASEEMQYVPDEPASRSASLVAATPAGLESRAANFTWLADDSILEPLLGRCRALLPETLPGGAEFVGLNARLRLYRYLPGSVYRPHVDGAWPMSGKTEAGDYEYDLRGGEVRSRFTFLIYLNEGFSGGCTTFFTAGHDGEVQAQGVAPRVGMALIFPHGEGSGSLVHEGSAIVQGVKYVARTDVLYTVPGTRVAGR
jgi:hypothetical protein